MKSAAVRRSETWALLPSDAILKFVLPLFGTGCQEPGTHRSQHPLHLRFQVIDANSSQNHLYALPYCAGPYRDRLQRRSGE